MKAMITTIVPCHDIQIINAGFQLGSLIKRQLNSANLNRRCIVSLTNAQQKIG